MVAYGHTGLRQNQNGDWVDWQGQVKAYGNGSQEPAVPWDGGAQEPTRDNYFVVGAAPWEFGMQPGQYGYDQDPYDQTEQNRNWDGQYFDDGGSSGGTDWGSLLQNILGGAGNALGGLNLQALLPALYASQRGADEMNEQAGRYEDLGREAMGVADPWGQANRTKYQGKLDELLADPTKSPVYQSMMREAMGALGPRLAAQGRAGSDAGGGDWLRSIGDVSNKYTGEWADRYGRFGGSEINPAQAASMLMEGGRLAGDARAQALAARLYPLGMLGGQGGSGGSGGTSGGSGGSLGGGIQDLLRQVSNLLKPSSGGGSPGGSSGGGASGSDVMNLIRMLGTNAGSLTGLWPSGTPVGPGLEELYGNIGNGNWDFLTGGGGGDSGIYGPGEYDYGDGGNYGIEIPDYQGDFGGGDFDFGALEDYFGISEGW